MVDSDYKQQSEEQMFGTSVPEGERADESTFAKCLEDNEAEVIAKGRASPTRNPSIKELLFNSLAAAPQQDSTEKEHSATIPLAVDDDELMRSRNNSLRNGETSKVIENLDIEAPKLEKEQIEEYLRFKALKNSQQQHSGNGVAPRDRKLSQEYFKEEAKRLDKVLLEGKHLKSTFAPENTNQAPKKKRFTCFKARDECQSLPLVYGLYEKMPSDVE